MVCTLCIAQLQYRWVRGRRGTIQNSFLAPELVFKCKREKMRKILNVFLSLAWQAVSKYGLNYQGCSPALLMSRVSLDPVVHCWAQAVQSSILCSSRVHLGLVCETAWVRPGEKTRWDDVRSGETRGERDHVGQTRLTEQVRRGKIRNRPFPLSLSCSLSAWSSSAITSIKPSLSGSMLS